MTDMSDLYKIWYGDAKWGFLTAPTVKKIEFQKSKMADGRHFENRQIAISRQRFDQF